MIQREVSPNIMNERRRRSTSRIHHPLLFLAEQARMQLSLDIERVLVREFVINWLGRWSPRNTWMVTCLRKREEM